MALLLLLGTLLSPRGVISQRALQTRNKAWEIEREIEGERERAHSAPSGHPLRYLSHLPACTPVPSHLSFPSWDSG